MSKVFEASQLENLHNRIKKRMEENTGYDDMPVIADELMHDIYEYRNLLDSLMIMAYAEGSAGAIALIEELFEEE